MAIADAELNKKATKFFMTQLSDGVGLTYNDIVRKARVEFGYTDRWVNKFLLDFEKSIEHTDGGFIKWLK